MRVHRKKGSVEPAAICDCVPESRVRPRKHAFCVQIAIASFEILRIMTPGIETGDDVSRRCQQAQQMGRDVPSVRISLQSLITVSFFSLSVHSPNVVSIYPPAVCTHPLPSQRLSRHQWTLTQRTEHWHSSLKQRTHFRCLCIS